MSNLARPEPERNNSLSNANKNGRFPRRVIITPGEFQGICDQAILAVDVQGWPADALPHEIAKAVITDVHKRVCAQIGEGYDDNQSILPNEKRIEEIVKLVSRHWSGPILVERTINETIRMVLEHWRERHDSP